VNEAALLHLATLLRDGGYGFVTPTPATHARVNARPPNRWARDLRDVFGWSRPFRDGLLPDALMAAMRDAGVLAACGDPDAGPGDAPAWRSTVRLSSLHGLLLVHSAYPTGDADSVFFGPDTYRYAAALDAWLAGRAAPVRRGVDIGSGSGAGAILVARARPDAEVWAADINPAALLLTRVNAALAGVAVRAVHSDLLAGIEGEFDLACANPPYLADPSERAYRHGGGPLGAGLSLRIVAEAPLRLAPGGTLLLYTGVAIVSGRDPFHDAATTQLQAHDDVEWSYREMDPDVFGEELEHDPYGAADRIAAVVLTATRNGT
jgi:SAM-dependent methyltransferase